MFDTCRNVFFLNSSIQVMMSDEADSSLLNNEYFPGVCGYFIFYLVESSGVVLNLAQSHTECMRGIWM